MGLDDPSSSDSFGEAFDLATQRIQSRLLEKHIKNGRLVAAVSTIDVARPNGGNDKRRIHTTLSFSRNRHNEADAGAGTSNTSNADEGIHANESFGNLLAIASEQRDASAAAAGLEFLQSLR